MQCNRHYRAVSQVCARAGGERETSSCPTPLHDTMIFWKQNVRMRIHKRLNSKDLAPRARFELATLRLTAEDCRTLNALFGVAYDRERLKSRPSVGQLLGNQLKRRKAVESNCIPYF